jgi:haloacetate dehalogenase
MFEGFESIKITTSGATINLVTKGSGPGLLLLHGFPETHTMWHKVAPLLAEHFTVVVPDLRGYGDSEKIKGDPEHNNYSKRAMAKDQVEVMTNLGFDSFFVAGHDRGARVSHRLAKDNPDKVKKMILLDIIPTREMFKKVDQAMATNTYHWFFLIQPEGFPETMISGSAEYYVKSRLKAVHADCFTEESINEYVRCGVQPGTIHAWCEDYRAGASIDLVHDDEDFDEKLEMPLKVLWSSTGHVGKNNDVINVWNDYASNVNGYQVDSGHFIPEEIPQDIFEEFISFFKD